MSSDSTLSLSTTKIFAKIAWLSWRRISLLADLPMYNTHGGLF